MLEKPDLPDQLILKRVKEEYGLRFDQVDFLPLGADEDTAVYRLGLLDDAGTFLKLRRGSFDEVAVLLPQFLKSQGIQAILAPLETKNGRPWGSLEPYQMILYPFVPGKDGYEMALSEHQWVTLGETLRKIHGARAPEDLLQRLPRETYSAKWRDMVRNFRALVETTPFPDPVAAEFASLMQAKRAEIAHMLARADQLGRALASRPREFVICHSDVHPGNLLIPEETGESGVVYLVDWDAPVQAPKEHDLTLIGGCFTWRDPREEALFYQGYNPAEIDPDALAYYRYERILEDIAVEGKQILLSLEEGENRAQELRFFKSSFSPGHEVELAFEKDPERNVDR
jgi:spectinomycin phosphotransferase